MKRVVVRLFVAVELAPPAVEVVEALERPLLASLRWTDPSQWHVTLRFVGELDEPAALAAALGQVPRELGGAPLEARLGPAAAWFPGRRVLHVPVAGLDRLAEVVRRITSAWGDPPEAPFLGHLTLARARGQARGPASLAGTPVVAAWPVRELVLFSSTLGPGGARYEAVQRVGLMAG